MPKKQKQSREEWERGFLAKQSNLIFEQSQRAVSHIAEVSNLPTLNTAELIQLVIGAVLLVLGAAASTWGGPYSAVCGLIAVVIGLYLILRSFIMHRR